MLSDQYHDFLRLADGYSQCSNGINQTLAGRGLGRLMLAVCVVDSGRDFTDASDDVALL
jgi:hypothetical protein